MEISLYSRCCLALFSRSWFLYSIGVMPNCFLNKRRKYTSLIKQRAGTFDGGIYFPQAVLSQMFRTVDGEYGEIMKKVARRDYVELG